MIFPFIFARNNKTVNNVRRKANVKRVNNNVKGVDTGKFLSYDKITGKKINTRKMVRTPKKVIAVKKVTTIKRINDTNRVNNVKKVDNTVIRVIKKNDIDNLKNRINKSIFRPRHTLISHGKIYNVCKTCPSYLRKNIKRLGVKN